MALMPPLITSCLEVSLPFMVILRLPEVYEFLQARGGHGGGLEVDALPSVVVMGMGGSLRMLEDGPLESSGLEDEWMAVAPVHGQDEHPQSHISQALQHPLGNNHMVHAMPRDVRGFRTSHMTSRRSAQLPQVHFAPATHFVLHAIVCENLMPLSCRAEARVSSPLNEQ
jgi:hypothetical protein